MPDPKLLWFHSTERKSVYVEGQNFVPDADSRPRAGGPSQAPLGES